MKKFITMILAAASIFAAVSCNRTFDEKEVPSDGTIYITRTYEAGLDESTKTTIDATGKVTWEQGDLIRYYSQKNGEVREYTIPEGAAHADLTLDVASTASFLIGVYGGTGLTDNIGSSVTIQGAIPAEQTGVFGDHHVAITKTYDVTQQSLTFHNIVSYMKFTLTRADVAKVVFKANDATTLCGDGIRVSFVSDSEAIDDVAFIGTGSNEITINNGGAGTFYIATLPCTMAGGFQADCYDATGVYLGSVTTSKSVEVKPGKVLNLGIIDTRMEQIFTDLSAAGTANSYLVSEPGHYKFKANVKGNSTTALDGTPVRARVLWESFGTDETPTVGDIVSGVTFNEGYIQFTSGKNGNAVIAVENRDEDILWSWHIWVCDGYSPAATDQVYNNGAGTMMDRNLGATSATPGDVHALGLLYQWGRKDPFLGGNAIDSNTQASSTSVWPSSVSSNSSIGNIVYVVSHPMTFVGSNENNNDWYYAEDGTTDNTRWQTTENAKGMYDPCPPGYRVPEGGPEGIWAGALGTSTAWDTPSNWDSLKLGMDFGSTDRTLGTGTIWYPYSGFRDSYTGQLSAVGQYGRYWSCTPREANAYRLSLGEGGTIVQNHYYRANGRSVRCYKEGSSTFVPVTAISLNKTSVTIENGKTDQLTATITPASANVKTVTWSTSNSSIATVSSTGLVTAKGAGTCTITATSYNGLKATCEITVTTPVTAISLNKTSATIENGKTLQLTATIIPTTATNKTVTWSTSSSNVATVSSAGLVTAKAVGTCTITATSSNGLKATCAVTVVAPGTDLSASGTANSYIVSAAGTYKIKTVKGNSTTSVGTVASASVLWESFGTSTKPAVGDLISGVKVEGNYITFTASSKKGNAVIAAKNSSGTILWSWHIWLTDKPADQVYKNSAGTMMDRNLGATSATAGSVGALGLLYQWGRKDPFMSYSAIGSKTVAVSTISWPAAVASNSTNGTTAYSISHPTTFIKQNSNNYDWYYSSSSSTDNTRWKSTKGLYDPCPPGYRVPDGGLSGIWYKAYNPSQPTVDVSRYNSTNKGCAFNTLLSSSASSVWYPCAGGIYGTDGDWRYPGQGGTVWSCSSDTQISPYAYYFSYGHYVTSTNSTSNARVYLTGSGYRADGHSVRCQKM